MTTPGSAPANRKARRRQAKLARPQRPRPPHPELRRGLELFKAGALAEAASACRRALVARPRDAAALHLLGAITAAQGRYGDAVQLFAQAVEIEPKSAQMHRNLGTALLKLGKVDAATAAFRRALEIEPDDTAALNNLGNALKRRLAYAEALRCYERALELEPRDADIHFNRGNAYKGLEQYAKAIASYERALEHDPNHVEALTFLINMLAHTCSWNRLAEFGARADSLSRKRLESDRQVPETPLANLARCDDPALNLAIARQYSRDLANDLLGANDRFDTQAHRGARERITVGYLSTDFRAHPVALLMRGVFRLHARDTFRVHAYSAGPDDRSEIRREIAASCDRFVDVSRLDPVSTAQRIREDEVDILVELNGHTGDTRLAVCALRPAPINVAYLGFPGSSGADYMDYILTDRIVSPPEHAEFYSERLVWLPHSYQANNDRQPISDRVLTRAEFGLPEDGFVFCSFNQSFKIEPVMFDVWMRLLRAVPNGVLWIGQSNELADENLRREAEARGVGAQRLVFAGKLPKEQHLARFRLADLALDTRIYNGHTTTSDALWAGVPVVAVLGRHFASRVSASLLTAIGLPELIAQSLEEYEALALRLAREPEALAALRQRLAEQRFRAPLFDTAGFVRALEAAYRRMFEIFLAGEAPRMFAVPA